MKKNYSFTGITGYQLKGVTEKKSYKIDKVYCNEFSSYINWEEWNDDDEYSDTINHSVSINDLIEAYREKLERENG